ncbi:MAG: hypothetical protein AAF223_09720, partial [Bacteroidota bacterium]
QGEVMAQFPANGVSAETLPEPVLRQLEAVATQVLDGKSSLPDTTFTYVAQLILGSIDPSRMDELFSQCRGTLAYSFT